MGTKRTAAAGREPIGGIGGRCGSGVDIKPKKRADADDVLTAGEAVPLRKAKGQIRRRESVTLAGMERHIRSRG